MEKQPCKCNFCNFSKIIEKTKHLLSEEEMENLRSIWSEYEDLSIQVDLYSSKYGSISFSDLEF